MFPSTRLVFTKSCRLRISAHQAAAALAMGGNIGNVNQAGEPPTTAASSTHGSSSAPWPAAKRRLETGTFLLEFLPGGGVNLDVFI